jgi:hypothetical protein
MAAASSQTEDRLINIQLSPSHLKLLERLAREGYEVADVTSYEEVSVDYLFHMLESAHRHAGSIVGKSARDISSDGRRTSGGRPPRNPR